MEKINYCISAEFNHHFKIVVANTAKLQEEAYKIRYDVYCRELNYENPDDYPTCMEQDIYDRRSIHCLLKHRLSGMSAGCIRVVLADPFHPKAPFPFENICHDSLDANFNALAKLPRTSFCEVSRFAVRSQFRRCQFLSDFGNQISLVPLGLYLAATSVALEFGVDIFAMMEPRLSRHLRRYGFPSRQIGGLVEHRGKRSPFQFFREAILNNLQTDTYNLLQTLRSELTESLQLLPRFYHQAA